MTGSTVLPACTVYGGTVLPGHAVRRLVLPVLNLLPNGVVLHVPVDARHVLTLCYLLTLHYLQTLLLKLCDALMLEADGQTAQRVRQRQLQVTVLT